MKRSLLIFLVSLMLISHKMASQTRDSTVNVLLSINENIYIGKPLDSVIAVLPSGYISMKIISGGHQYTARKLRIQYPDQVWIDLHVREFHYMNPRDNNRIWNVALMRKEKLYKTVIYKHIICYRNCDVW